MKQPLNRRSLVLGASALAVWARCGPGLAQPRPPTARIVVGVPPGGPGDLLARTIADRMRGAYAPVMLVENKPGAAAQLAISSVRNGPADGSQMLLTPSSPLSLYPSTFKTLPYRPQADFVPLALLGSANHAFAVGPQVPADVLNLADYLAWAKKNPGLANFGSPASGAIPHLLGIAIANHSGVPLTHVAYRGSVPGVQDMVGGQISAMISPLGFFLQHLSGGHVRVLAVSGDARSRFLPQVATLREQGIPLTAREWYGMFMHAKAPPALVQSAQASIAAALEDGTVAVAMGRAGFDIQHGSARTLAEMLQADTAEWSAVVKRVGFTAES